MDEELYNTARELTASIWDQVVVLYYVQLVALYLILRRSNVCWISLNFPNFQTYLKWITAHECYVESMFR